MTNIDFDKLNEKFETATPQEILKWAIETFPNAVGLSSSFGGESAALLHMAVQIEPKIPVLFLNTGFLFKETLQFKETLKNKLNLQIREFKATAADIETVKLKLSDPNNMKGSCCDDVKVDLMKQSLEGIHCWIAGLRRQQASTRKNIKIIERYGDGLIKVHPIANWSPKQIYEYMKKHDLPFHPLWEKGYKSIGCEPCTTLPLPGEDDRSGRWAGREKTECGIHTFLKQEKPN